MNRQSFLKWRQMGFHATKMRVIRSAIQNAISFGQCLADCTYDFCSFWGQPICPHGKGASDE